MTSAWTTSNLLAKFRQKKTGEPTWLTERRTAAAAAFSERGLANERRQEERFRFMNLTALSAIPWRIAPEPDAADASLLARHGLSDAGCQLVFVDGMFRPGLSRLTTGITAGGLSEQIPDAIRPYLATTATRFGENPFLCLNTMFFRDAAWLHLPTGTKLATPISIVNLASSQSGGAMLCPRLLVVAEADAEATLVEQYIGADVGYWTNAVTEIVLHERANLTHYRLQSESSSGAQCAATEILQRGEGSKYRTLAINTGAALSRHDLNAVLDATDLHATLNGLNFLAGEQISDTHSRIEHLQPNSQSNELYKGVLADRARAVFNGRIFVHQLAQKTNAFQANPNILLSDDAVINSNPELEIYADDVRCTHGATCGDLDADALFYLRSRGFGKDKAVDLLVYAFVSELLAEINIASLRDRLQKTVFDKLARSRQTALAA